MVRVWLYVIFSVHIYACVRYKQAVTSHGRENGDACEKGARSTTSQLLYHTNYVIRSYDMQMLDKEKGSHGHPPRESVLGYYHPI